MVFMRFTFALCCIFLLVSCGVNRNVLEVRVERCPAPAVLSGTDMLVRYQGIGRSGDDVTYIANISNVDLQCTQGDDVVSEMSFDVSVRAGPALNAPMTVTLPYFVVLLRDNSQIVSKKVFETKLTIDPNNPQSGSRETITQRFASIEQPRRYDYELLVGLQVSLDDAVTTLQR